MDVVRAVCATLMCTSCRVLTLEIALTIAMNPSSLIFVFRQDRLNLVKWLRLVFSRVVTTLRQSSWPNFTTLPVKRVYPLKKRSKVCRDTNLGMAERRSASPAVVISSLLYELRLLFDVEIQNLQAIGGLVNQILEGFAIIVCQVTASSEEHYQWR